MFLFVRDRNCGKIMLRRKIKLNLRRSRQKQRYIVKAKFRSILTSELQKFHLFKSELKLHRLFVFQCSSSDLSPFETE